MDVTELNKEQLSELKSAYFWQEETAELLPDYITYPEQIPDDVIFSHYSGVCFVNDDFCCSAYS